MAIVESQLKNGTLKFGTSPVKEWSCQVRNVKCVPTHNKSDSVETLCGDLTLPITTTTWQLTGKIVSDFAAESATSIVRWTHQHDGEDFPFELLPNDDTGTDKIGGTVRILPLELGGDVSTRIEIDFAFDMDGAPVYTAVA